MGMKRVEGITLADFNMLHRMRHLDLVIPGHNIRFGHGGWMIARNISTGLEYVVGRLEGNDCLLYRILRKHREKRLTIDTESPLESSFVPTGG